MGQTSVAEVKLSGGCCRALRPPIAGNHKLGWNWLFQAERGRGFFCEEGHTLFILENHWKKSICLVDLNARGRGGDVDYLAGGEGPQ